MKWGGEPFTRDSTPATSRLTGATAAATRELRNHNTGGEFDDILSEMPAEIRGILQNA